MKILSMTTMRDSLDLPVYEKYVEKRSTHTAVLLVVAECTTCKHAEVLTFPINSAEEAVRLLKDLIACQDCSQCSDIKH